MKYLILRLLRKIYFAFKRLFNAGIPLKFVVILCVLVGVFTYLSTHNALIRDVGGTEDYAEAKRYIEIKDVLDEYFIEPVDRSVMADAAASSMVLGLGDPWSYFMTADEYRAYQLSAGNDYADIGLSIVKDEANGGFQVISVYPGSPAANAGVGTGMIITALDGEKLLGQVCRVRQEFSLQPPRPGTVSFLFVSRITSTCYSGYEIVRQRHRKKHPVPLPTSLSGLGTDSVESGGWEAGDGGGEVRS